MVKLEKNVQYLSMSRIFIETNRLVLRSWKAADYNLFALMNADKEVMKYFPNPLEKEQTIRFVEERIKPHFKTYGYGVYAVELKTLQRFIGFCGFMHPQFESFFTPCIEIGWRIDKRFWNMGYATEAAQACLHFGFTVLKFSDVFSFTSIHNKASERVMQKIGMQKTGTFMHPSITENSYLQEHVLYKISI